MICTPIKYGLFCILLVSMVIGCNGLFKRAGEEEATKSKENRKDAVSPLSMPEDFEIVPEKYPLVAMADTSAKGFADNRNVTEDSAAIGGSYETYRIQLFTSKTYGPAAREQKIAREVFDKDIYLDYEVPYYKVRIGDFSSFDNAEIYLPAAVEAGYKNAWVVKVAVNVQKIEEPYDENFPPLINPTDTNAIIPEQINDNPQNPEN